MHSWTMGDESAEGKKFKTVRENLIEEVFEDTGEVVLSAQLDPDHGNWKLLEFSLMFLVFSEK